MLLLGFDAESTGLSFEKDKIIEVGAVIWCTESRAPKLIYNELVMWPDFTGLSQEIVNLTGITADDVADYGKPPLEVFTYLLNLIKSCNYVVAHNGNAFDKPMLIAALNKLELELVEKPWIDTMTDIDFSSSVKTRNLPHLCADHGFLNPFSHRAVFDVLSMFKVLDKYDIYSVLALASEPVVLMQAICKAPWEDQGKSTTIAKQNGFRWDGDNKRWVKQVKKSQAEKMGQLENLQVRILG